MNIEIEKMNNEHLNSIKDNLITDFDDFWNLQIFEQELANNNSYYVIAKIEDEIVGFGGVWQAVDEMHITNIAVKKDRRNMKIGSKILDNLIEITKSKNIKNLTLEVNINNIPAIKLYEKYQFKKLGLRKKYYNNIDDALIMTLYLN